MYFHPCVVCIATRISDGKELLQAQKEYKLIKSIKFCDEESPLILNSEEFGKLDGKCSTNV